jgi:hypothetical protein
MIQVTSSTYQRFQLHMPGKTRNQHLFRGIQIPELTTVLLILPRLLADRERLFAFSIFSQDVLKERRASEDDLWRR